MTNEELMAIRERVEEAKPDGYGVGQLALRDVPKLLAEIERLRELLNKAYQYGTSSEAYRDEKVIEEIYEYIYGGDDE